MYDAIMSSLGKTEEVLVKASEKVLEKASETSILPFKTPESKPKSLFDVNDFIQMIDTASSTRKKEIYNNQENVSAYDLTSNCIRHVVLKILNYPAPSYSDGWLPLGFRGALGSAVHNYIQDNYTGFTELEASIKVPSIKTSVRLDAMINDDVLVEIKSCPFTDYKKIIKTRTPRDPDFYQTIFYRWLLHNHLQEAKEQTVLRTQPPKLDKYNIDKIQFIYVAHDLVAADVGSLPEALNLVKHMKKLLKSRNNPFYFITALTIDLNAIDVKPYEAYVVQKLNSILKYVKTNTIPPLDDSFIDKGNCFFCPYYNICKTI